MSKTRTRVYTGRHAARPVRHVDRATHKPDARTGSARHERRAQGIGSVIKDNIRAPAPRPRAPPSTDTGAAAVARRGRSDHARECSIRKPPLRCVRDLQKKKA